MKLFFFKSEQPKSSHKIFWAALTVGACTVAAKAGATIKELLVARWFGRGDAIDAFLIAYLLPSFVVNLTMAALIGALVPAFISAREREGKEAAQRLLSNMMFLTVIALLGITLLLGLFAPYYLHLLGSSFSPEKLGLTRELLYALLPFILCNGITACISSILNAQEKFALPALTLITTPIVTILFLE